MKIYDCFMFFDEEMLLDLRLNIMDKYVDKFVITEATYTHSGKPKKLLFDIQKFSKFKDKIIYNVVDKQPPNIEVIYEHDKDSKDTRGQKLVNNSSKREHFQRDVAIESLKKIDPEDIILINDIDEIPNLEGLNWYGSKACKKKYFISPQWLRETKHKKYSFLRLDTIFSKKKYSSIHYVENGGWHFSNIKSPEDIERKFSNYLHHQEFEYSGLNIEDIKKIMNEKKILYDHGLDRTKDKLLSSKKLKKVSLLEMPNYLNENQKKYGQWLDV